MDLAESGNEGKGRHFVLVHGACHGAWCWFKLSDLLKNAGHRVTAIDLSASGTNPKDAEEVRSWSQNNEPLLHLFNSILPDGKVILVGHSMGGVNLTCIMEQFPDKIGAAVFVTAFMPLSGTSVMQLLNEVEARIGTWGDTEFNYGRGPHNPPTSFKFGKQFLRQYIYQRSPSQDITLAETLVRKHPLCEGEVVYTGERYGRVKRVYVVAKEDKAIWEDLQRKMIADNPPDRVYEMEESDHCPFFCNPSGLGQHSFRHFRGLSVIKRATSTYRDPSTRKKPYGSTSSLCEPSQHSIRAVYVELMFFMMLAVISCCSEACDSCNYFIC